MKGYPLIVATDATNTAVYALDFETIHEQGIPHRSVHLEIVDQQGRYLVWNRSDGRLEIPGGHVDWLSDQDRAETYEEAGVREIIEELNLLENWGLDFPSASERLQKHLDFAARLENNVPSSHGKNHEWVTVFKLQWQQSWGNPCDAGWISSSEMNAPHWLSLTDIHQESMQGVAHINAALRLFLQRHRIPA